MFEKLDAYLAPLREVDWSTWQSRPAGLLETPASFGVRYGSIPPEAVPILTLGVDGCHYALWIDDPRTLAVEPGVVFVSPTDPYPDALRWVAPSIASFAEIIRSDDDWLSRRDPRIQAARARAEKRRAAEIVTETADGVGIVDLGASSVTPGADRTEPDGIRTLLRRLLSTGAHVDALVVARNAIAELGPQPPGFGALIAEVYDALKRPEYAVVALQSYETTEKQWQLFAGLVPRKPATRSRR